jgi:hypothetical protein
VFKITSFLSTDFSMARRDDMFRIVHSAEDWAGDLGWAAMEMSRDFTRINTEGAA